MTELESFLSIMFGDQEGFIYLPTKDPKSGSFKQKFFSWPKQKSDAILWVNERTKTQEVYISPAIFKIPKVSYSSFKGTYHVWCEFDGTLPSRLGDIPEPSIKIQSSTKGHEHWYWRLRDFEVNATRVAEISKRLAYTLGADLSGWDATQVLRPPTTKHHASGKIVAKVQENDFSYPLDSFETLQEATPSDAIPDIQAKDLPDFEVTVALYKWNFDAFDLLRKPSIPVGSRSSSLTRLAFECLEMGMSDPEILSIIYNADQRWKKFANRDDQIKRLQGIIAHVRSKKATDEILVNTDEILVYRYGDLINTKIELAWIVEDILPVAGKGVLYGPPGCGKSTWCLRMAMNVATGKDAFLNWNIVDKKKVLFMSFEMGLDELKHFFSVMEVPSEDHFLLQENLFIYPVGHSWPLFDFDNKVKLLKMIDEKEIDVVIFDSLGTAAPGRVNDDESINSLNSFLNEELCKNRSVSYWFVHHPRKPSSGAEIRKPQDLYEMFGSIYIAANAQTVISMWWRGTTKDKSKLVLEIQKARHSNGLTSISIDRQSNLSFRVVHGGTMGRSSANLKGVEEQ